MICFPLIPIVSLVIAAQAATTTHGQVRLAQGSPQSEERPRSAQRERRRAEEEQPGRVERLDGGEQRRRTDGEKPTPTVQQEWPPPRERAVSAAEEQIERDRGRLSRQRRRLEEDRIRLESEVGRQPAFNEQLREQEQHLELLESRLKARERILHDRRERGDFVGSDVRRLEDVQRRRHERVERGGVQVIEEPDKRVIVRKSGRSLIRHDEVERFRRLGHDLRTEHRPDGTILTIDSRSNDIQIVTEQAPEGQLLRRYRRNQGRETVLINNRTFYAAPGGLWRPFDPSELVVDVPEPKINFARSDYIVKYSSASQDDIYEALTAPPVGSLMRSYSSDEVRYSRSLRRYMRRIDLDDLSFEFGAWDLDQAAYRRLERVAHALERVISRAPNDIFLIEGHTDAVGSELDNLTLSDRRAEAVAIALTETFGIPSENLTTQGYGEQDLKIETESSEGANRRVSVRRITPLISQMN